MLYFTSCRTVGFAMILSLVVTVAFVLIQINGVAAFHCTNRRPEITITSSRKIFNNHYLYIKPNDEILRQSIKNGQTCHRQNFWQHNKQQQQQQRTKMSTKDDDVTAAQSNVIQTSTINATTTTPIDSTTTNINNRSSISRTLLLAIPLMFKFALVLMIKFLTDLVVFPLLFAYRAIRIMKRRIFKVWSRWTSSTTTTSDHDSNEGSSLQLENFNANGSVASTDTNMGNLAPKP